MNRQSEDKIYLAPFQGITTRVFREIYTRHFKGTDKLFTAFFTSIYNTKSLNSRKKELTETSHNGVPVVPQILSKDASEMLLFGKLCHELGFEEINWNLGCPFPRVARKMRGSGLLPHPQKVEEILEAVMPQLPLKLSVKCRLGYHSSGEITALIPVFNKFPLSEIIVHTRIGEQMYKGGVDTGTFVKVLQTSCHQTVYNGDIFSPEDFEAIKQHFLQLSYWMIGRGLLADPFLPMLIKGGKMPPEPFKIIRKYVDDLYFAYRQNFNDSLRAINVMKELWSWLSLSFDHPQKIFGKIKKCISFDAYEEAVNAVFEDYIWEGEGGKRLKEKS